jgi:hypothetical protein
LFGGCGGPWRTGHRTCMAGEYLGVLLVHAFYSADVGSELFSTSGGPLPRWQFPTSGGLLPRWLFPTVGASSGRQMFSRSVASPVEVRR